MPASRQIHSTRSAVYPVRSTISSFVAPDMAAPAIGRSSRFLLDEFVLRRWYASMARLALLWKRCAPLPWTAPVECWDASIAS
jgi:hypothetical protein